MVNFLVRGPLTRLTARCTPIHQPAGTWRKYVAESTHCNRGSAGWILPNIAPGWRAAQALTRMLTKETTARFEPTLLRLGYSHRQYIIEKCTSFANGYVTQFSLT